MFRFLIKLLFFSFVQTQSGQTEALIEKGTAEKIGDYMHGCSFKNMGGSVRYS